MKVISAEFVMSVPVGGALPGDSGPIVALVGRSNVGKSSLVNAFVKQRIARSGSTPGTTRLINVYRLHVSRAGRRSRMVTFADLPGYGYARGGQATQREFEQLTAEFFVRSPSHSVRDVRRAPTVAVGLLVVDIRHPGLQVDLDAHTWLGELGLPVVVAATKSDRMSRSARLTAHRDHERALGCPVVAVSCKSGDGMSALGEALLEAIPDLL